MENATGHRDKRIKLDEDSDKIKGIFTRVGGALTIDLQKLQSEEIAGLFWPKINETIIQTLKEEKDIETLTILINNPKPRYPLDYIGYISGIISGINASVKNLNIINNSAGEKNKSSFLLYADRGSPEALRNHGKNLVSINIQTGTKLALGFSEAILYLAQNGGKIERAELNPISGEWKYAEKLQIGQNLLLVRGLVAIKKISEMDLGDKPNPAAELSLPALAALSVKDDSRKL